MCQMRSTPAINRTRHVGSLPARGNARPCVNMSLTALLCFINVFKTFFAGQQQSLHGARICNRWGNVFSFTKNRSV